MPWKNLLKRDSAALKWLLQRHPARVAATYSGGPNTDLKHRIYAGEKARFKPIGDVLSVYNWALWIDDDWIEKFSNAPPKIQAAALRQTKTSAPISGQSIKREAIFEIPKGTTDIEGYLKAWGESEAQIFNQKISKRSERLSSQEKNTFYHAGPPGYTIGHVIKPYFKTPQMIGSHVMEALEDRFEKRRELNGAKIPRLDSAYAFENPEDAVVFALGGARQLYRVKPMGYYERRDMNCIDAVEARAADIKSAIEAGENDNDEESNDPYIDLLNEEITKIIDAYWTGKPCADNRRNPVWEIVTRDGFEVVGIEDRPIQEVLLKIFVSLLV